MIMQPPPRIPMPPIRNPWFLLATAVAAALAAVCLKRKADNEKKENGK